jgi:HD-like signal output (HDOD) protein
MDPLEAFRTIAAQTSRGELVFPTNVNAALKIKQALDDPDASLADVAKLVLAEPLLSARTVAIANSAAYNRAGTEISNVTTAVMRLGVRTLGSLTASLIVQQLSSKASAPALRAKADQLWQHSAHVAALAQVIARRTTKVDPESAMFAGIVHEVGGFYLLSRAEEFPGLLDGAPEDWVEYGEKVIGRGVLKALAIPEVISEAIEIMWQDGGARPPASLGDVLALANKLAPVLSPLQQSSEADAVAAQMTTDFPIGDTTLWGILEEAADEIKQLTALLIH